MKYMEEFILNDSGELFIRWNVNTNFRKLAMNELVSMLLQEFRQTGEAYQTFTEIDGKLIGGEKVAIIRNLREIIQISIEIKNILFTKYIKTQNPSDKLKFKFIDEYSFQITYHYTEKEINSIKSVKEWYDNYFKVEVLNFINDLKRALDDKIITEEEALGLSEILNQMIIGAAILYNKLSYENIIN